MTAAWLPWPRLQVDQHAAGVAAWCCWRRRRRRTSSGSRTSGSSSTRCAAACCSSRHARVRHVLRGFDARLQLAGVLGREQALGNHDVQQHRQRQRRPAPPAASAAGAPAPIAASGRSARSRGRRSAARAAPSRSRRPSACGLSQRADIIGTRVSETTAEIRIVIASVTANSRNSRPTTSPMNSSGISTAISDTVSEMMVKPICGRALQRGLHRRLALLDVARDVLDHHDRVVDHEAGRDGQRHQAQVVQAVAQQVHQRRRCRSARSAPPGWRSRWRAGCAGRRRSPAPPAPPPAAARSAHA